MHAISCMVILIENRTCHLLFYFGKIFSKITCCRTTKLIKFSFNRYFFWTERAVELGQDMRKQEFKDQSWLGLKTRSRDATLSRHKGININELYLHTKLAQTPTGETWRGKWQGNEIAAKILALRECTPRISRDFNNEYPKLRFDF